MSAFVCFMLLECFSDLLDVDVFGVSENLDLLHCSNLVEHIVVVAFVFVWRMAVPPFCSGLDLVIRRRFFSLLNMKSTAMPVMSANYSSSSAIRRSTVLLKSFSSELIFFFI